MKRETIRPIVYFVLAALTGTLLHFLYDWSPNLLFALISPVRESVWEHLKLIYWPLLVFGLIFTRKDRAQRPGWYLGLLVAAGLLLLFGWVVNIRMGVESMPVDIIAFLVILFLGFAVAAWIPVPARAGGPLALLTAVLGILILVFTFCQPEGLLFADLSLADALYTLPC